MSHIYYANTTKKAIIIPLFYDKHDLNHYTDSFWLLVEKIKI
ncbi:hypothetical protein LD85_2310 [Saccharolobus islandicus L.D.8.5]|uniref:Uncharacterized protein n=1 Tax=Saccharolobus islandicus (strain L.D.8.5 / Lassen \|nr:hypothetical protein LD85_2310 [Sulfolobus islandicus L.D.8.5]